GMVATGFWLGLTVGRVVLGFVTGRIGEKLAVALYLALSVGLQLLFWLIPSFIASAVFAAFLGFFLGPLFPAAIMVATKLLPPRLHVSAIGFVAAFGSSGAAVFPFVVGAIAQAKGVWVLQPRQRREDEAAQAAEEQRAREAAAAAEKYASGLHQWKLFRGFCCRAEKEVDASTYVLEFSNRSEE
ncbi:hypothetical protein V491_04737, partial [Pseudogymnoascus sp. VKM F-3775]